MGKTEHAHNSFTAPVKLTSYNASLLVKILREQLEGKTFSMDIIPKNDKNPWTGLNERLGDQEVILEDSMHEKMHSLITIWIRKKGENRKQPINQCIPVFKKSAGKAGVLYRIRYPSNKPGHECNFEFIAAVTYEKGNTEYWSIKVY